MRKTLLMALPLVSLSAMAAPQVPTFTELNLSSIVSNGYFHGNAFLADLDNDGIFEMIVKGRDLNNGWATEVKALKGDGLSFTESSLIPTDDANWERVVVPCDFNCDGKLDLILGSSWNAKLLKGNGDGTFTNVEEFALDGEISIDGDDSEKWYAGLMAVADFNNDGYPDIITFCGNPREDQGAPTLFLNDKGTGKFTKVDDCGLAPQRGGTIAYADFNRDGFMDVAVSGWNDSYGNDCIKVYKNNGDATFSEVAPLDFVNLNAGTEKGQIIFADVNGDGYADLFVTGESCPQNWAKQAAIYLNNNGTSFSLLNTSLPGVKASGADWCDLNGDGLLDLVYAGESDNGAKTIVAINQGDNVFEAKEDLMGGHRGGATVHVGDMNNNLQPDVMVMGYNDNGPHFQIFNNLCSRGINELPTAPKTATAKETAAGVEFAWEAGVDSKTPVEALRYNLYVKLNDGTVFANVPADFESGKLLQADVNASLSSLSYTLGVKLADIAEWGVQTIDNGKAVSAFTKGTATTSVGSVAAAAPSFSYTAGVLTVSEDAFVEVFNAAGVRVAAFKGTSASLNLASGIYVVRAAGEVVKLVVK